MKALMTGLAVTAVGLAVAAPQWKSDEVLVRFKATSEGSATAVHNRIGASTETVFRNIGWQSVRLPAGMTVPEALAYYRSRPEVEKVQPNYVRRPFIRPNDPRYPDQYDKAIMGMPEAWNLTIGRPTVVVAVIDTGLQQSHPDFVGRQVFPRNTVNDTSDTSDVDGHGTHVCGIAAATGNNGIGVAGMSWGTKLMPIKAGDFFFFEDDLLDAYTWAETNGAKVVNLSLGGPFKSDAEEAAMNRMVAAGITVIAAAGNDNSSAFSYPAAIESVIAVGSTDSTDSKSDFSNFGDWVDIAAPGTDILSTLPGSGYGNNSGTSMASPNAAGYAGLLWSLAPPNTTVARIRQIIESNTVNVGGWVATGRIDPVRGLRQLPRPGNLVGNVVGVNRVFGSSHSGSVADLFSLNRTGFVVGSSMAAGLGQAASARVLLRSPISRSNVASVEVRLSSFGGSQMGTTSVWARNQRTGAYVFQRAYPMSSATSTQIFNLDPTLYLSSTGEVDLQVRGLLPLRMYNGNPPRFNFTVDWARIAVSRLN